ATSLNFIAPSWYGNVTGAWCANLMTVLSCAPTGAMRAASARTTTASASRRFITHFPPGRDRRRSSRLKVSQRCVDAARDCADHATHAPVASRLCQHPLEAPIRNEPHDGNHDVQ